MTGATHYPFCTTGRGPRDARTSRWVTRTLQDQFLFCEMGKLVFNFENLSTCSQHVVASSNVLTAAQVNKSGRFIRTAPWCQKAQNESDVWMLVSDGWQSHRWGIIWGVMNNNAKSSDSVWRNRLYCFPLLWLLDSPWGSMRFLSTRFINERHSNSHSPGARSRCLVVRKQN